MITAHRSLVHVRGAFLSAVRRRSPLRSFSSAVTELLQELRQVDTSSICDADKSLISNPSENDTYAGLRILQGLKPFNCFENGRVMAGVARTVQLDVPDDFLAVLQGLEDAQRDEVLVVNTRNSKRAVAGELFCAEGQRKGLSGIVIDGPARDSLHLRKYSSIRFYAKSLCPYSGSIQSPGTMQSPTSCGDVLVSPGDILMGDQDGIVVGSLVAFKKILPLAKQIITTEADLLSEISGGKKLVGMTNFKEHLDRRARGLQSSLEFRIS